MKHRYNSNVINEWSQELGYFLGLLVTDGCVVHNKRHGRLLTISLIEPDRKVLDDLLTWLESKNKIYLYKKRKPSIINGRDVITRHRMAVLRISHPEIISFVIKTGICEYNKTRDQTEMNIPDSIFPHFLRGVVDGDGFVSVVRTNRSINPTLRIGVTGNQPFLRYLSNTTASLLKIKPVRVYLSSQNCHSMVFCSNNAIAIRDFIYKDARIFLERKKSLAYLSGFSSTNNRPLGYWKNRENLMDEINSIIKKMDCWPSSSVLHDHYSALYSAINRWHGGYTNVTRAFFSQAECANG